MKNKMFKYCSNLSTFYNQHPSASSSDDGYIISADSSTIIGTPGILWENICFIEAEKLVWTHGEFFCEKETELPSYSSSDSGKILSVNSSGQLVWITPVSIYSGNDAPNNQQGNNGDIYLQTD